MDLQPSRIASADLSIGYLLGRTKHENWKKSGSQRMNAGTHFFLLHHSELSRHYHGPTLMAANYDEQIEFH